MNRVRHLGALLPVVILVAGMALTCIAAWYVGTVIHARNLERFRRAIRETNVDIAARLDMYTAMLRGASGLYEAGGMRSRAAFRRYVDRLETTTRYPGVGGIGVSVRLAAAELEDALERVRREDPAFVLHQPEPRDEYHTIIYLEPLDERNQRAIGFDMFLEPVRRAAMERARDTGAPAASGKVTLIQETDHDRQAGFLIYLPLYRDGVPTTVEERRERLVGFAYCPFRADDFFRQVEADQVYRLVNFEAYDGDQVAEGARLNAPPVEPARTPRFRETSSFPVAGRTWTIAYTSRPELERATGGFLLLVIGAGGLAFTFLLFGAALAQHRARLRAERHAVEIEESGVLSRASESRLRSILDSAQDAVISMDHAGVVTEWNPAAARTFGYAREEALGRPLADLIIPPYLREHHYKTLERLANQREEAAPGRRTETMAVRADGSELPVELSIVCVGECDPPAYTTFVRDITERRRAEKHRELMTRELDHRVKNNLSTVVALVEQTAASSDSFGAFVASFSGRIRAMARLHEALAVNRWTGADLGDVIRGVVAPYLGEDESRITLEGDPLDLPDKILSPLSLAFHELATNAGKYGSLSVLEGRVEISWRVDRSAAGERVLQIEWREVNGPAVAPPSRRGFGTELVERGLAYEVRAKTLIDYAEDGVRCEISLAIPDETVVVRRRRPAHAANG